MRRKRVWLWLPLALTVRAFGQPVLFPPVLRVGAPLGTTAPVTDTIVLSSAGSSAQDFDTAIRYSNGPGGWLSLSPASGRTPKKIVVSADPSNLPAGTYEAQILATVGPLHLSAWTSVLFTVAPAASNPGGLGVSPSSLLFQGNSTSSDLTISVANAPGSGVQATPFSVYVNSTGWLTVVSQDATTPGAVKVRANLQGLSSGTYTASVTLTSAGGKSTVVPVTFVVPRNVPGQTVTLSVAQRALQFQHQSGAANPPSQTVIVSTDAAVYQQYTATASDPWIGVSPASYIAPSSTASATAPGLLYVAVNPTGLAVGTYTGKVTLASSGATGVELPVTLSVISTPVVNVNPSFISLDTDSQILTSNLSITGSTAFVFSAAVAPNTPWLTLAATGGVASPYGVDIGLSANVTGLPPGVYNSSVTITASGGTPKITVPVILTVTGVSVTAALQTSPKSLDFTVISGDKPAAQGIVVMSAQAVAQSFVASATAEAGWISIDPMSGQTPMQAKVTVSSDLAPGTYTGSLVFTPVPDGEATTVTVKYKVIARTLTATPSSLTFTQTQQGAAVLPQEVQISANAPSSFRIVSQPDWAKVQASILFTPAKLVVSVDPTGLDAGSYNGVIRLTGPGDLLIPVSLTVPAIPPPTVAPTSLAFAYELGAAAPAAQTLRIDNPSGSARFSAGAATESGLNWLTVSPTDGSTPGALTVRLNVALLTPGKHAGAITVRVDGAAARTLTVPVALTVTGTATDVRDILNSATMAPGPIAPGELVTIFGRGLGPLAPVSARPSSAGAYGVDLGGMRVYFDELPAPLLYAQEQQINAIVPYGVYGRATVRIHVESAAGYSLPIETKVADAAPGIFTLSPGARGQAAALNADNTANSASNPIDRGSVVAIYLTGEGQTDPPGQDGRIINTDFRKPLLPVTATVGGAEAEVLFAGSASSLVSGVCQVNVRIPDAVPPGAQPIEIRIGGIPTQGGVTITVR
jgi:uncharacterized protein (TIGR03437 family)